MRRKAFLFTFLVLSLLLAACVRGGGTEGENSYTIYYPAAELRDVPGEDAIVARTVQLPDADTLTQEELAQRLLERLLADAPDAGVRAPMPGGTTLLSMSVLGNWARVDFSRQYARLAGIDLTLVYDTDLVAELKEAANHYLAALKSRDASLVTDDEMLFLASVSSVPLLRILNLASVARYEGLAADIVSTYVEAAAYEALVGALEALTSDIRRVMGSSSATTLSAEHAKHVKALVLRISDVEESLALRRDKVVQAMNRAAAFVTQLEHIEKSLKSNAALDVTELTEGGVR